MIRGDSGGLSGQAGPRLTFVELGGGDLVIWAEPQLEYRGQGILALRFCGE